MVATWQKQYSGKDHNVRKYKFRNHFIAGNGVLNIEISSDVLHVQLTLVGCPVHFSYCQYGGFSLQHNLYVVKVSYGRRSQVADGHLGRAQVADTQTFNPVSYGQRISLTIYILKFKFKAQIMNFTVIHRGHASCSHHVHTLYAHEVSFTITHLLHNAHCTHTLPFAPFPHMLTYFTI